MSSRTALRWASFAAVLAVAGACRVAEPPPLPDSGPNAESQPSGLLPVPTPDLDRLEPAVRDRIRFAVSELDRLLEGQISEPAESGRRMGELCMLFHAHSLHEVAEPCYSNAHQLEPREMRWAYYLGQLYRNAGNAEQSEGFFRRALEADPDYLPTYLALAGVYRDAGRSGDAEDLLLRALAHDPDDGPALIALGKVANVRKDHQQAVRYLERARALVPEATEIHYPLGLAYRGLGRVDEARKLLARRGNVKAPTGDTLMAELRQLETGFRLLQNRGNAAFVQGRYREAVEEFQKAVRAAPENAQVRANLASALSRLGDDEGALVQSREALRLDPDNARANFSLGTLMARGGRDEEAVRHYLRAVAGDPGLLDAHYNLANALGRLGRTAEALRHYSRVVELDPRHGQARYGQGVSLLRLARWPEAREALEASHSALPEVRPIANVLARLLAACPVDRLRDGRRALAIAESNYRTETSLSHVETVAMALAELGRYPEAVQYQEAALTAARNAGRKDLEVVLRANLDRYRSGRPCREPWP